MKVFLSCHFPISSFVKRCIEISKAIEIEIIIANQISAGYLPEKIKKCINECEGILFILQDKNDNNMSEWMATEYGISSALNLPTGIINCSKIGVPKIFSNLKEYLHADCISEEINIIKYLYNFKKRIDENNRRAVFSDQPTFVRLYVQIKKPHILI